MILGSGNDTALSLIDVLPARTIEGRGGNDVLDADDGVADLSISCGDGIDVAKLDLKDPNPVDAAQCARTSTRRRSLTAGRAGARHSIARGHRGTVSLSGVHGKQVRVTSRERGKFGEKIVIHTLRIAG